MFTLIADCYDRMDDCEASVPKSYCSYKEYKEFLCCAYCKKWDAIAAEGDSSAAMYDGLELRNITYRNLKQHGKNKPCTDR